jgi:hypothetical protein
MRMLILGLLIVMTIFCADPKALGQQDSTSPGDNVTAPSGIDWGILCNDISQMNVLYQSCSDLVNQNGTLTTAGDIAIGCIKNGLSLGLEALHHGVSLSRVIFGLGLLTQPAGCGGVINMNAIESSNQFQFLTRALGLH